MKLYINKKLLILALLTCTLMSCEDFLDKEPPSYLVPEDYYKTEEQIQACANKFYPDILPSHTGGGYGQFQFDNNTDNQAQLRNPDSKYAKDQWKTGMDNSSWAWENIRNINYQLNTILEKYNNKEITGADKNIRQYIGEIYFFRAYEYFKKLQSFGDFPIVKEAFADNEAILVAANKRSPRNEVARFILEDLDQAISYMSDNFDSRHTRISPDVAYLVKSRVALFEASWLTNFKGTPFVPNGEGWLGKNKDYNANYQYPTGSIDEEAKYFFEVAAKSAEIVADKYKGNLVTNTGIIPQSNADTENPYFSMFGNINMSKYSEVLLWREYNEGLNVKNNVEVAIQYGNWGTGPTRSLVEAFLMKDGKPIYASSYTYSDESLQEVVNNRDPRLKIFLKVPGQKNVFKNMDYAKGDQSVEVEPIPNITNLQDEKGYSTGYSLRKGGTFDRALCSNWNGYTAAITFRATEALLNYIEAQYMLTKSLSSGKTIEYWKIIRERAGFTSTGADPLSTIAATDINKEKLDWGAYTSGTLIADPVLYNIRRERRCELMAEGLRWMDLIRWRSLEQMKTTPYHIEGFRVWSSTIASWYNFTTNDYNGSGSAKVSSPTLSDYYRPYQKNMGGGNLYKDGYTWALAQYLQPLPIKQFLLTASDHASVELSPLYQNPYWPTEPSQPAIK